jgi:Glycosyl hydrolase family 12
MVAPGPHQNEPRRATHRTGSAPRRRFAAPPSVAVLAGIAAVVLVIGGLVAARYLGGPSRNASDHVGKISRGSGPGPAGLSAAPSATSPSGSASPKPTHTSRPSHSTAPSHTSAPTTPASAPTTQPPPATSAACKDPSFSTSQPTGGESNGNYYLYNNMWNASGYSVAQTLYACSYHDWYVVANMNNDSGNGAVKTYPDVQANFNEPKISSFHSVSSTFAESSPHVGIYEDAYDIWLNGVASSGSTELMIWTENFHQVPAGSVVATASLGGRSYKVWKNGSYIAFAAESNFTSGTLNLLQFFDWIIGKGWIPSTSTLGQICYGVELVSTNSAPATFNFTNFSVSTS